MKPNICLSILFLCVLSAVSASATGIPDLSNCTVTCAYTGPGHPVMYNVPNGMGSGFDHCNIGLDVIDATIHVVLKDGNGVPMPHHYNSPDISGDLQVNLMDVGLFASDYFGAYSFRADLVPDGVLSLSDVGRFAMALGSMCP
ncbi:hypothetical protein KJ682_13460 [bacterium]|nr:hypothetical protein [bacterium]